jgi:hypothetical protein
VERARKDHRGGTSKPTPGIHRALVAVVHGSHGKGGVLPSPLW